MFFLVRLPPGTSVSCIYVHLPVSFSSKKTSHGGRSSHPSPNQPTISAEVKCKEPGANINSSRFKIYRRQSLTIPNTERKNSPPLRLGGFRERCHGELGWVCLGFRCWWCWVACFWVLVGWSCWVWTMFQKKVSFFRKRLKKGQNHLKLNLNKHE